MPFAIFGNITCADGTGDKCQSCSIRSSGL